MASIHRGAALRSRASTVKSVRIVEPAEEAVLAAVEVGTDTEAGPHKVPARRSTQRGSGGGSVHSEESVRGLSRTRTRGREGRGG